MRFEIPRSKLSRLVGSVQCWIALMACAQAKDANEYRESQREVAKVAVTLNGEFLEAVTFLRLSDGSLQDPVIYYYQGHYTGTGVQRVEKPGNVSQMISKDRQFLFLPVSTNISDYLFLVRQATVKRDVVDGVTRKSTKWSRWAFFEISAAQVRKEPRISVPPFEAIEKLAGERETLLSELEAMYEKAKAAADIRAKTPVKRSDVPWYAR
jgi:hypothetical protein